MKIKIGTLSLAIVAACGTLQTWAQPTTTYETSRDRETWPGGRYHLGRLEKASKVIGTEIKGSQGEKLGKVKDLAIDLENGRIVEVIMGTGGVMGVDERLVAVPPGQFTFAVNMKALQLNVDRAQIKSAPVFVLADWESNVREANVLAVYQRYSVKPYFNPEGTQNASAHLDKAQLAGGANPNDQPPVRLGEVQRASKLMGVTTRNTQNEKLGKVENFAVDLPAGRVVEVILASGGFLGRGDELSAVPPQAFRRGIHPDTLTLDTTKATLTSAPHFKSSEWAKANNPQQVEAVYQAYNVPPYFTENAVDNTAQNVRDRADSTLTPLDQGSSPADLAITREIRKEIMASARPVGERPECKNHYGEWARDLARAGLWRRREAPDRGYRRQRRHPPQAWMTSFKSKTFPPQVQ